MKKSRNPQSVHEPVGRYVHSIEVSQEGRLLFISGQVGRDTNGDVPAEVEKQFEIALRNVLQAVDAAGFAPSDVVKLTTYCVAEIDRTARRAALDAAFGDHITTSTLVYVPRLVAPEYLVEVEAWASRA
jgi:enamine deaminase RidA (YjgF/YER057c/UK114 family)